MLHSAALFWEPQDQLKTMDEQINNRDTHCFQLKTCCLYFVTCESVTLSDPPTNHTIIFRIWLPAACMLTSDDTSSIASMLIAPTKLSAMPATIASPLTCISAWGKVALKIPNDWTDCYTYPWSILFFFWYFVTASVDFSGLVSRAVQGGSGSNGTSARSLVHQRLKFACMCNSSSSFTS